MSLQPSTDSAQTTDIVPRRGDRRRPSVTSDDPKDSESQQQADDAVVRCLGLGDNFNDDDELDLPTGLSSGRLSNYSSASSVNSQGGPSTPNDSLTQRGVVFAAFGDVRRKKCMQLADNKIFTCVFMVLTFYALFAPDVDAWAGTKTSYFVLSVVNTAVCALFTVEIIVQCLGKEKYFPKAYFWLDTVAMISLLPETWAMQRIMGSNSGFAAGRSSRLARIVRVASRSSKATRLNRLTRIARMASLLPKISAVFGNRISPAEIQKLVNKKLNRAFRLLDPGGTNDGKIPRQKVVSFIERTRAEFAKPSKSSTPSVIGGLRNRSSSKSSQPSSLRSQSGTASQISTASRVTSKREIGESIMGPAMTGPSMESSPTSTDYRGGATSIATVDLTRSVISRRISNDDMLFDDTDTVDYREFAEMMQSDAVIGARLSRSCEMSIRRGNNMRTITRIHSEYIAVRVALAVILLLFVIGLVSPLIEDFTLLSGLEHLTITMRYKYPNATSGEVVPQNVQNQMLVFFRGADDSADGREIFYLDVNKLIYCNRFTYGYRNCSIPRTESYWGSRTDLEDLDKLVENSDYRFQDFAMFAVPDLSDEDLNDDERNERTRTVALIYDRASRQLEAKLSIMTTALVIIVILSGVVLLTRDLTYMSRNLLKPLRELADDMESIAQLQLAGATESDHLTVARGTDEIKQIRRTFENMKKAIKSWGKYVPWPVVQKLLQANIEADLKVEEVEASMYFSDIAGFTTIVESLPPEKSLLLLNRYFNDMTKVIDDLGGVVIEFIGDAIYCVYGQPLENRLHPKAAVQGALRMLSALRKLNAWAATKDLPQVSIRCGVHTGMVLVGNMGFGSRMKYGIVGEDAQFPSRLEELNKTYTTKCLISDSTNKRLQLIQPDHFITRPVDYIQLRQAPGSEPEWIHEVMAKDRKEGKVHPYWEVADLHASGMELYRRREFAQAVDVFEQVQDFFEGLREDIKEDGPAVLMLKRCRAYLESPPSESWNGVWDG